MNLIKCLCNCLWVFFSLNPCISDQEVYVDGQKNSVIPQMRSFAPGRGGENYKEKGKCDTLICRNVF